MCVCMCVCLMEVELCECRFPAACFRFSAHSDVVHDEPVLLELTYLVLVHFTKGVGVHIRET